MIDVDKDTKPTVIFLRDYLADVEGTFAKSCIPKKTLTQDDVGPEGDYQGRKVGEVVVVTDDDGEETPAYTYDQQEYVDLLQDLQHRVKEALGKV